MYPYPDHLIPNIYKLYYQIDMPYSTNSSVTDIDFDDVSSFSSIDSYKPEPFTGDLDNNSKIDTTLMESDTIVKHDTRTTVNSTATNNTTTSSATTSTPLSQRRSQELNSMNSLNTLRKHYSRSVERRMTNNALKDNVESIESLAAKGLNGSQRIIPDINSPLTMTRTAELMGC